jgi:hypothetical protein
MEQTSNECDVFTKRMKNDGIATCVTTAIYHVRWTSQDTFNVL